MILQTWEIGGSNPQFWKGEFTHTPQYAVVQFCQVQEVDAAVRSAAAPARSATTRPTRPAGYVVLVRDLGSLRVPPFVAFVMSTILFGLGLLGLHWREK